MATRFLALVAAGILALTAPARSQYYPTPAEELHAQRLGGYGIFAWGERDQLTVWTALEAIKGTPGIDDLLLGRATRIQEKMRTRGIVWVGAHGEHWLPPIKLTLPEMILSGFALSRYYCRPEEQDIAREQADVFCEALNMESQALMRQIASWAPEAN